MNEWKYEPAPDLDKQFGERLRAFPRQPHIWIYALRIAFGFLIRAWLKIYHRLEIRGLDNLPVGESFIIVANHQSHLDTLGLSAAIPYLLLHRTFPAAAADYFFKNIRRSLFSTVVVNAIPFDRNNQGPESLQICRELLQNPGNILIIFPEGTRSETDEIRKFRLGIGRLVEGLSVPVVPCKIVGAARALPKGAILPRPTKLLLHFGAPRSYQDMPMGRKTTLSIVSDLESAVRAIEP